MTFDERILSDVNPAQREAVLHGEGPLLILAGAGSGKTRVITYRIAHLLSRGVNPWNILAITFTNKAAQELRRRVDALTLPAAAPSELFPRAPAGGLGRSVWVSTFHSFCAQFLRVEAKALGMDPNYVVYDDDDQRKIIKECLQELSLDETKHKPGQVLAVISRAKDDLLDADSYAIHALAQNDPFRQKAATIYAVYQKKLAQANALDFGDLILKTVVALRDNAAVREKYQQRFRHILIDEYQDTNHAQYLMVKHLVSPPKNLCVVGDDDQAVYSWRGADIRNIMEFERDYPGAKVVKLEQNYRSTEPILAAAHSVIRRNQFRKDKKLWTERTGGEPVRFQEFANEIEEARFIVGETARLLAEGAVQRRDVAVFYRTNAQSRVLEDAFRRENIPYIVVGSVRFYERQEVKDALAYLRLLLNPADSISVKRVVNVPPRGLGKTTLQALENHAALHGTTFYDAIVQAARVPNLTAAARGNLQKFLDVVRELRPKLESLTASQMVRAILEQTGYWAHWEGKVDDDPEAAARLDNLQELVNAAKDFEESSEDKSLAVFLERVSLASDLDAWKEEEGAVTLMTVHLAKGLEFPAVYVTGLEEGLFPIGESAFSQEELEEERRLCYVAMTRARERLMLTSAASRKIYGRSHWNVPSRFVQEAGLAIVPAAGPSPFLPSADRPSSPARGEATRPVVAGFDPDEDASSSYPTRKPLRVGMRVRHPSFGSGEILEKSGSGENVKVTVLFDSGARKNILARYADFEFL
ncbi:MAG: ATP-dependent helicase [Elusimicrobiota bacterium]